MTAPLLHMALQRCRDDKGPVCKAGLALLEALLLVRHKADRTVLPDAAALAAVADAARDHLVRGAPRRGCQCGVCSVGNKRAQHVGCGARVGACCMSDR